MRCSSPCQDERQSARDAQVTLELDLIDVPLAGILPMTEYEFFCQKETKEKRDHNLSMVCACAISSIS